MRSALRKNLPAPAGTFSCSRARCYTCSFLNSATSISGPKSNFVIRHNFICTSSNIIYCIPCSKCCKLYIGETGRRLSDRIVEHLRSIRNNDVDKPVAGHFNTANHSSPFLVVMIAVKDRKSDSFIKLEAFIPTGSMNDFLLFDPFIVSVFVQHVRTTAVTSHLFTVLFMFIHLPLIYFAPPPRLPIDFKNIK